MVIVEVVADLGIPERTPVTELRVNPEGSGEVEVNIEGASVVIVWLKATPAVAVTAALEINAGPVAAWTVTPKLPVAVLPDRELLALNPKEKVPLMSEPGVSVMMPLFSSIEAQLGFEVSV